MLNVVIIGGGITGFSTAIGLKLSGHAVTLLEKEEGFKELSSSNPWAVSASSRQFVRKGFIASN